MRTIDFVIPVYNEEKRIGKTIKALSKRLIFRGLRVQKIIFVNDGSTDKTGLKIRAARPKIERIWKAKVVYLYYRKNMGKGYAIRQGLTASNADYTLFFDADMSTPLAELAKFVSPMKDGVSIIVGTRKNGKSTVMKHQPFVREMLGHGFTFFANVLFGLWMTDFTCGFKAFSRKARTAIVPLATVNRWGYDAELLYLGKTLGFSITEMAVKWSNDERTKVNLMSDIKQTIIDLVRLRFRSLTAMPAVEKIPLKQYAKSI